MNLLELIKGQTMFNADTGNGGDESSGDNDNPTDNNQGDNNGTEPTNQNDKPIPYNRFKSVVDQKNEYKQKYDELIQQQEQQQREQQEKQGEYETLYNDLKAKYEPVNEQFKQYQETFKQLLETKKQSVPEDMQDLIPQGNELEQLKWIEQAQAKGLFTKEKPKDFGNKGSNPDQSNNKKTRLGLNKLSRF